MGRQAEMTVKGRCGRAGRDDSEGEEWECRQR